ncbi:MAG: DMT family transporter [Tumebacillaceae bacterium]
MTKSRAYLMLVLANLFWAGNYVFGSYVVAELSPVWIALTRWVLALFLLVPVAHIFEKPDWRGALRTSWWPLLWMGILGCAIYSIIVYYALRYTTSTSAALVQAINPALLVLCSAFLLRERVNKWQSAGFVLSLLGVLVILCHGNLVQLFHTDYNRGDLLMIIAVIAWTIYSIVSKKLTGIPPITATALSTLFGILVLAPFAWHEGWPFAHVGALGWTGIVYFTLFPSFGSYILWNLSVRKVGAGEAGIFLNLIPFFTALISLLLGQVPTVAQLIGGLFVIGGVMLATGLLPRRSTRTQNRRITPE